MISVVKGVLIYLVLSRYCYVATAILLSLYKYELFKVTLILRLTVPHLACVHLGQSVEKCPLRLEQQVFGTA